MLCEFVYLGTKKLWSKISLSLLINISSPKLRNAPLKVHNNDSRMTGMNTAISTVWSNVYLRAYILELSILKAQYSVRATGTFLMLKEQFTKKKKKKKIQSLYTQPVADGKSDEVSSSTKQQQQHFSWTTELKNNREKKQNGSIRLVRRDPHLLTPQDPELIWEDVVHNLYIRSMSCTNFSLAAGVNNVFSNQFSILGLQET